MLKDYQLEAVNKFKSLDYGALFMEPGTGKTLTILEIIKQKKVKKIILISKKELYDSFVHEMKKFNYCFEIIFYPFSSFNSDERYKNVKVNKKDFLIIDESLFIKNIKSKTTKNILKLNAKYKFILNGTPISKNYTDLYTQMEFLSPNILNMNYGSFLFNFCKIEAISHRNGIKIVGNKNEDILLKLIAPYVYEKKLELDVKLIEKKINYNILIDYEFIKLIKSINKSNCAGTITLLQRKQNTLYKEELLLSLLNKDEDYIINFSFLSDLYQIKNKINFHKTFVFTGKNKELKPFLDCNKRKILLKTTLSGGFGLNLQQINNIINYDYNFDLAKNIQNIRRIYRMGQEKDVNIINFNCENGIDFIFQNNLIKKETIYNHIFMNLSKISNEIEMIRINQIEDLFFGNMKLKIYSKQEKEIMDKINKESVIKLKYSGITNIEDENLDFMIKDYDLSFENINKIFYYLLEKGVSIYQRKEEIDLDSFKEGFISNKEIITINHNLSAFNNSYVNSIYKTKNFNGTSFVDRITDSKFLKKAIMVSLINKKNPINILKKWGNIPTNFKPTRAYEIYKYLLKDLKKTNLNIYDPCFGHGGRILGLYLLAYKNPNINYNYFGYDVNYESKKDIVKMMNYLCKLKNFKFKLTIQSSETVNYEEADLIFTSPPYFKTEIYEKDNENQSINK